MLGLALLLATSGCITRPGEQLAQIATEFGSTQPRLEHTSGAFQVTSVSGAVASGHAAGQELRNTILARWQSHGFIAGHTDVAAAGFTGEADLNLTWNGARTERGNPTLRVLNAFSLALVPYTVDTTLDVEVVAENVQTGEIFTAAASDRYRTTRELLLVLAAPFAGAGEQRTLDTLADHLFEQLREQGAFDRVERETAYASRRPGAERNR